MIRRSLRRLLAAALGLALLLPLAAAAGTKSLGFADLMKLRQIEDPVISEDGAWVAYALVPDRGDGRAVVRSTGGASEYEIERGAAPRISADSRWAAARVEPSLEEREKAKGNGGKGGDDEGPKPGLALLALDDGALLTWERVERFAFSGDGRWLARQHFEEEKKDEGEKDRGEEEGEEEGEAEEEPEEGEEAASAEAAKTEEPELEPVPGEPTPVLPAETPPAAEEEEAENDEKKKDERLGTTLVLRQLAEGREIEIPHVEAWAFDEEGEVLAYTVAAPGGEGNGVFVWRLAEPEAPPAPVAGGTRGRYTGLAWPKEGPARLAFVAAVDDEDGEPGDGALWVWDEAGGAREVVAAAAAPEGWFLPSVNELAWSRDGERLFFGFKPLDEKVEKEGGDGEAEPAAAVAESEEGAESEEEGEGEGEQESGEKGEEEPEEPFDPYDFDAILEGRGVDVWHGDDPLIQSQQKELWKEEKDRVYRAVHHLASGETVLLAGRTMREVQPVDNARAALGTADVPYLEEITWDGFYADAFRISLADGTRQQVAERLPGMPSLSPDGRWAAYYRTPHWYLFDGESGETHNLTEGLGVPFADEDHDYPRDAPGYGVAGWVEGGEAVLIYDKYDAWQFPTRGGEPLNLTAGEGRAGTTIYRLEDLDPERDFFHPDETLLLTAYHDRLKTRGFAAARVGRAGVSPLVGEEAKTYTFLAKAKEADRLLFSRESYTEFPDLWVADLAGGSGELTGLRKITDANPEIADYAWGSAELVEWASADGVPLQGVLIKPGNYEDGKRYPVLVYFYRFFSQRLHRFNQPVVNHRPSFPVYASHGYAVFLPDIRFEVGRPGLSAVKALVPGVQTLVDMGVADPDAIGLHGHSWSGYQTAFVVTQTHLFKAAVAGAPVSNMTSAYGGIRYGSGMARMFQYEKSQSRLGASLWQRRDLYIDNSPLFFADRIETPLLIQFGDEDEAVPWTQGIELYLALRRLGKEVIFLQYRGEPHHLKKYGNKLDYSIKMKQFFDHHLKGEPAPEWMTEGVPYRGE